MEGISERVTEMDVEASTAIQHHLRRPSEETGHAEQSTLSRLLSYERE